LFDFHDFPPLLAIELYVTYTIISIANRNIENQEKSEKRLICRFGRVWGTDKKD